MSGPSSESQNLKIERLPDVTPGAGPSTLPVQGSPINPPSFEGLAEPSSSKFSSIAQLTSTGENSSELFKAMLMSNPIISGGINAWKGLEWVATTQGAANTNYITTNLAQSEKYNNFMDDARAGFQKDVKQSAQTGNQPNTNWLLNLILTMSSTDTSIATAQVAGALDPVHLAGKENLADYEDLKNQLYGQYIHQGQNPVQAEYNAQRDAYNQIQFPGTYRLMAETIGPELLFPYGKALGGAKALATLNAASTYKTPFMKLTKSALDLWKEGFTNVGKDFTKIVKINGQRVRVPDYGAFNQLNQRDIKQLTEAGLIRIDPASGAIIRTVDPNSSIGQQLLKQYDAKYYKHRPVPSQEELPLLGPELPPQPGILPEANVRGLTPGTAEAKAVQDVNLNIERLSEAQRSAAISRAINEVDDMADPYTKVRKLNNKDLLNDTTLTDEIPTDPAIVGKYTDTWTIPDVIKDFKIAAKNKKYHIIRPTQIPELRAFISEKGINVYTTSDPKIGTVRKSINGETEFYIGAFDDPTKPAVNQGLYTKPHERYYIMYKPGIANVKDSFYIRTGADEPITAFDVNTKENVTAMMNEVVRKADEEIAIIQKERGSAKVKDLPNLVYKEKQIEFQKRLDLHNLEQRDIEYFPQPQRPMSTATPGEREQFTRVFNEIYDIEYFAVRDPKKQLRRQSLINFRSDLINRYDPNYSYGTKPVPDYQYEGYYRPISDLDKELNDTMIREINNAFKNKTTADAWFETLKIVARRRGLPEPSTPHGVASARGTFDDSVGALDVLLDNPQGVLNNGRDIIAKWFGMRQVAKVEMEQFLDSGNKLLTKAGVGTKVIRDGKKAVEVSPAEIKRYTSDLHNPNIRRDDIIPPEGWEDIHSSLMEVAKKEESEYMAFFQKYDMAEEYNMFDSNPNYFPQMWNAPSEYTYKNGKWDLIEGAKGHLKERNLMSWDAKIEAGWSPRTWNPFEMMAMRRIRGIEHREGLLLQRKLKSQGVAHSVNPDPGNLSKLDYRVPKVGPAFEGFLMRSSKTNELALLGETYVPGRVADVLENMLGVTNEAKLTIGSKRFDVLDMLASFASKVKQTLLLATGFQDFDMLFRAMYGVTGRAAMKPIQFLVGGPSVKISRVTPKKTALATTADLLTGRQRNPIISTLGLLPRILVSRLYGGEFMGMGRQAITNRILSGFRLYDDFNISLKMVAENGWNIEGDTSIYKRVYKEAVDEIAGSFNKTNKNDNVVTGRVKQLIAWNNSSLFQGTYREMQAFALENSIIPRLRKDNPLATPEQIARMAADAVNTMSSSLGAWDQIVQNKQVRDVISTVIFSPNETESWLKMGARAFTGDNKALYGEYWFGMVTFLAITANVLNYKNTGEFLPINAYSPIRTKSIDGDHDLPYIPVYNSRFMSPIIDTGRNGLPIYLDLVGQADTTIQWMLNPPSAINNRTSPMINFFRPYVTGKTFYGEPLETNLDKVSYSILQNLPLGIFQLGQLFREDVPLIESLLPEAESRIGTPGYLYQAGGLNVRAMSFDELLSEVATREGYEGTPVSWNNFIVNAEAGNLKETFFQTQLLSPESFSAGNTLKEEEWSTQVRAAIDKHPDIKAELELRSLTGLDREQNFSIVDQINRDRLTAEQIIVDELLKTKDFASFWPAISQANRQAFLKTATVDEVYKIYDKDKPRPKEDLPAARWDYYNILEGANDINNNLDWDLVEYEIRRHQNEVWTPEQTAHVNEQLNNKDHYANHVPYVAEIYTLRDEYANYFDMKYKFFENLNMLDTWKRYKEYGAGNDSTLFKKQNTEFADALDYINEFQRIQWQNDPRLRDLLLKLGYINKASVRNQLFPDLFK